MRKGKSLFRVVRVCCVCNRESPHRSRGRLKSDRPLKPGEPNVLAITPLIYFKAHGHFSQLGNCARVRVCEECLVRAIAPGRLPWSDEGAKLWNALQGTLADGFDGLKREAGLLAPLPPIQDGSLPLSTDGSLFGTYEVLTGDGRKQAK